MAEHRTDDRPTGSKSITQPQRGPLRLRVIGTARHGQVIEIAAARLTIGSGPHCTLRLRAPGVRPLQCLIVREPTGPVARSLAVETLLNGQRFREKLLQPGDRLQIGSVELELCDDGRATETISERTIIPQSTPQAVDINEFAPKIEPQPLHSVEFLARIERLEQQLSQLQMMDQATASAKLDDSVEEPMPAPAAASVPEGVIPDSPAELPSQTEERLQFDAEFTIANTRYECVCSELAKLESELDGLRARCDEQQSDAIRVRVDLELALATERDLRSDLERKLDEQSARVADLQAQCRSLQVEMEREPCMPPGMPPAPPTTPSVPVAPEFQPPQPTSVTDCWETPPATASASQHRRQELDWLAQQFANASAESVDESPDAELPPMAETTTCNSVAQPEIAEPEVAEPELVEPEVVEPEVVEPEVVEPEVAEPEVTEPEVTETELVEPEVTENEVAEPASAEPEVGEPEVAESEVAESEMAKPELVEPEVADSEGTELECDQPDESVAQSAPTGLDCNEESSLGPMSLFTARFLADRDNEGSIDASESPSDTHPAKTEESSTETATEKDETESVFARLSQAGIWKDSDHGSEIGPGSNPRPELSSLLSGDVNEVAETDEGDSTPTAPTWKQDTTGSLSGDDSIESYMERLLQRVRGDSGLTATSQPTDSVASERSPRTEADLNLSDPIAPEEPALLTESEYQPRSQAPELSAGLAAMRAIGNDHRRKHILRHAQRTWAAKSQAKLVGSVISLAVAFASFFYLDTHTELAAFGLFAGFGVAGLWIWQAVQYRKQLFGSLRLNTEQHPGNPPANPAEDRRKS